MRWSISFMNLDMEILPQIWVILIFSFYKLSVPFSLSSFGTLIIHRLLLLMYPIVHVGFLYLWLYNFKGSVFCYTDFSFACSFCYQCSILHFSFCSLYFSAPEFLFGSFCDFSLSNFSFCLCIFFWFHWIVYLCFLVAHWASLKQLISPFIGKNHIPCIWGYWVL